AAVYDFTLAGLTGDTQLYKAHLADRVFGLFDLMYDGLRNNQQFRDEYIKEGVTRACRIIQITGEFL
ncbi:MAG: hypothetical protein ACRD63_03190, partial [Pyrinomonadaceae bacterium]